FRAFADQLRDQTRSHERSARPSRHAADDDARLDVSRTETDHVSLTLFVSRDSGAQTIWATGVPDLERQSPIVESDLASKGWRFRRARREWLECLSES